jgi:hypothetical protein
MSDLGVQWFRTDMTRDQCRDTGMAMVLILLLLALLLGGEGYLIGAVCLHFLNMIAPQAFRPVAVVWLGVAHLLGAIMSRVILTLVFLVVVTPIGMARRMMGIDSLRLKQFGKSDDSVLHDRNHTFTAEDIQRPY